MALEEALALDIQEALNSVGQLETALTSAASLFASSLAEALTVLDSLQVGTVDASAVTTDIDAAVAAADLAPVVTADAGAVTTDIDAAVAAVDATVPLNVDAGNVAGEIDSAVAAADTTITIEADTAAAQSEIDALGTSADTAAGGVGDLSGATSGLGAVSGIAQGEVGGLASSASALGPEAAAGGAAVAGLGAAVGDFFTQALQSDTATARFNRSLGAMSDTVRHVDIGGLNEDLQALAQRTGQDDEALLHASARIFDLGTSAGIAAPEVAKTTKEVDALAIRATTLNPTLGQAGQVAESLTGALARGGKALNNYGISLTAADINARALSDTGKSTAAELTVYEKAAAGAALATERLGDKLGSDINAGAKTAEIQMKSLTEEFHNAIEEIGTPLIVPVIDLMRAGVPVGIELASVISDIGQVSIPILSSGMKEIEVPLHLLAQGLDTITVGLTFLEGKAGGGFLDTLGTSFFGALNPVVLLGKGIQDLTGADKESGAEAKAHEAAVKSLTTALSDQTKAQGASLIAATQAAVQAKDADEALAKLGVTYEQVAGFAGRGKDGIAEFDAVLSRGKADHKITGDDLSKLQSIMGSLGPEFQKSAKAALEYDVASGKISAGQLAQVESTTKLKGGATDYLTVLRQLAPSTEAAGAATKGLTLEEIKAETAGGRIADLFKTKTTPATKDVGQAAHSAADDVGTLTAQFDKLFNKAVTLDQAEIHYQESLAKLSAALKENGLNLELNTEKGRKNVGALDDLVKSGNDRITNLLKQGAGMDALGPAFESEIEDFRRVTREAGFTEEQTQALLNKYGLIPENLPTIIQLQGAEAAKAKIDELVSAFGVAQELAKISVQVFGVENARAALAGIRADSQIILPGHMAGGPVSAGEASIVGEVEPELFVPNVSGFVFNQAQLRQIVNSAATLGIQSAQTPAANSTVNNHVTVNEVAHDVRATAFAVSSRIGQGARR